MTDLTETPWIRGFAITPRRLSEGGWVWLTSYEWRWQRPDSSLPAALNPPRVYSRKARSKASKVLAANG
ncbi:hypothetical protein [Phenylobacterium deserti]|uniref:Uncharacterized protein n=1 Tax=Phenylobacterium deserti TaxID=1914756 RepID=A0A328AD13_9CAUL|nr:hypothetical protein [Phenylobacterium deserti]RAK52485.1 hypothetical protein DJ018_09730 [Phenylobacterium deserti]